MGGQWTERDQLAAQTAMFDVILDQIVEPLPREIPQVLVEDETAEEGES